jgi:hypothetical protein
VIAPREPDRDRRPFRVAPVSVELVQRESSRVGAPPPLTALAAPAAPFTPVSPTRLVDTCIGTGSQALAVGTGCTLPLKVLGAPVCRRPA